MDILHLTQLMSLKHNIHINTGIHTLTGRSFYKQHYSLKLIPQGRTFAKVTFVLSTDDEVFSALSLEGIVHALDDSKQPKSEAIYYHKQNWLNLLCYQVSNLR